MGGWLINPELCNEIVEDFKDRQPQWKRSHSTRGYWLLSNTELSNPLVHRYEQHLDEIIKKYVDIFPYSKEGMSPFNRDPLYNFQFYEPGHSYSTWHCENNGDLSNQQRHLAFMTYLNTVFDGGGTHFLHQDKIFTPQTGLTLVWPAYFTHTHRGIPAKTEVKYVTTGWYNFFDTNNHLRNIANLSDEEFYQITNEIISKLT